MGKVNPDRYSYRVTWSELDNEFVGTVAEFPSLSWLSADQADAFVGIQDLVREVVDDMLANGEEPPAPLSERKFSGKFQVRLTPEAHRRLATTAAEQHVSLNRLIASKLAS